MFGRRTRERLERVENRQDVREAAANTYSVTVAPPPAREQHQAEVLRTYQQAHAANAEAKDMLEQATRSAARAATLLAEARKQMRDVADGRI